MHTPTQPALPAFTPRVVPVIALHDVAHAVPLAHALLAGGIDVMEITLRTPQGLCTGSPCVQAGCPSERSLQRHSIEHIELVFTDRPESLYPCGFRPFLGVI